MAKHGCCMRREVLKKTELNHGMSRHPKGDNYTTRVKGFLNHTVNGYRSATAEPEGNTLISVLHVREGFTEKLTLDLDLE